MTSLPRHRGTSTPLTRRHLGQLAALGLVAGVGSVGPTSSAVAAETDDGRVHYARARRLAGTDPVLNALVTALTPGHEFPARPRRLRSSSSTTSPC